ncbi:hypothetical protein AAW51_0461 [Caldimonas brevitalea]|uniref:Uncharacterized protein n=1 Tax=Caldimonas brevitalea TaxID=413882 RepID=A0A0G3BCU3_9BURK|nr:hypothetical protein AAW51_0461 [Caldimonas brevitalea]
MELRARHAGEPGVDGLLIFNTVPSQVDAALARVGITLLPEDELAPPSVG